MISIAVLLSSTVSAQRTPIDSRSGSSSRKERKNAVEAIPFHKLTPQAAQRIQSVIKHPTIYRRLPIKTIESDQPLFVFLIRNPEVVVDIWKIMGVTQLTINRTGEFTFQSDDGAGTKSHFELLYGTPHLHVYHGTGYYEGSMLKNKVTGQCVIIMRTEHKVVDGRPMVKNRLDVFLDIDNHAADVIAKTISPLFARTADINFVETSKFLSRMSDAAENSSDGMHDLADRLPTVRADVRQQFESVACAVQGRVESLQDRANLSFDYSADPSQTARPANHIVR